MRVFTFIVCVLLTACGPRPIMVGPFPDGYPPDHVAHIGDSVFTGGQPRGIGGFGYLEDQDVRTIISVDAAIPDIASAESRGMRYVHIPMGYGEVDGMTKLRLARAIRDLPRPIYVHCHYGQHRGPTAAALALVCTGELTNDEALAFMTRAGTSRSYVGLWSSVEEAGVVDPSAIDSVGDDELVSAAEVDGLSATMAELDRVYAHLARLRWSDWRAPPDSPDLVPEAEAGRMADLFRAIVEGDELESESDEFREWMREAATTAADMEAAIVNGDTESATARFTAIDAACNRCHNAYRY